MRRFLSNYFDLLSNLIRLSYVIVNTCIYDAFGKGVSVSVYVCLSHDNLKTIADIYSTFCLLVTYTRAISRTISHVKITGKGQGYFFGRFKVTR